MKFFIIITLIICLSSGAFAHSQIPEEERKCEYKLKYSDRLFLFPEKGINKAQREVNEAIRRLKSRYTSEFVDDLKSFLNDPCPLSSINENELLLSSEISQDSEDLFSVRIDIYSYFHGSNGCQQKVVCLNFAMSEYGAKEILLSDLILSTNTLKLLRLSIKNLRGKIDDNIISSLLDEGGLEKYENVSGNTKPLSELIHFTINLQAMTIIFPAYTISCGADGILCSEISIKELDKILTPYGKKLFGDINTPRYR